MKNLMSKCGHTHNVMLPPILDTFQFYTQHTLLPNLTCLDGVYEIFIRATELNSI